MEMPYDSSLSLITDGVKSPEIGHMNSEDGNSLAIRAKIAVSPPKTSYAFIGGLHRSGTTLLARCIAENPEVSGFSGAKVIENEGQFLQSVLPQEVLLGGVGRFGFDPRAHLTELSPLNNAETRSTLTREWSPYWDAKRRIHLEKTPSNLLRMRLLQSLFPSSHFVVVTRHPVASALATIKWTDDNIFRLLYHWIHCYKIARADTAHLDRVLWVRYESLIADPAQELNRIERFLGVAPSDQYPRRFEDRNLGYFTEWKTQYLRNTDRSVPQPPGRSAPLLTRFSKRIEREFRQFQEFGWRPRTNRRNRYDALDAVAVLEPMFQEFGYSLLEPDFSSVHETGADGSGAHLDFARG
jgi:Sulfotransferase family